MTVRLSLPAANEPPGMGMVAAPAARATAVEVKLPLVKTTEPVGIEVAPLTVTLTDMACAVVMVGVEGVTLTVGVSAPETLMMR